MNKDSSIYEHVNNGDLERHVKKSKLYILRPFPSFSDCYLHICTTKFNQITIRFSSRGKPIPLYKKLYCLEKKGF